MGRFISHFDYLGYKEFILNNTKEDVERRVGHFITDIEISLSLRKFKPLNKGLIRSDISVSRINCLNISDTVLFWTNDDSVESFEELLKVSYEFNWREILFNSPTRGCMVFDDVDIITGSQQNSVGGTYNVNMIYGKGLVEAHIKSENQDWAGFVIDESVILQLSTATDIDQLLTPYAKRYNVPYKVPPINQNDEFVLLITKGLIDDKTFSNTENSIRNGFSRDNKNPNKPRVQSLINNTVTFLSTFREK